MEIGGVLRDLRVGKADLVDFTQRLSARNWRAGLFGLAALRELRVQSDTYAVNAAAASAAKSGPAWPWALQLLEGTSKDAVSCGVAASALRVAKQPAEASQLLAQWRRESLQPGLQTYNIVISAFADGACWRQACAQLLQARLDGLVPDLVSRSAVDLVHPEGAWRSTFDHFAWTASSVSWRRALHAAQRMRQQGTLTVSALASLARLTRWQHSLDLRLARARRSLREERNDRIALLQAVGAHDPPSAAQLLKSHDSDSSRVESGDLNPRVGAVLGCCGEQGAWRLSLELLDFLRQRRTPDAKAFCSAMDASASHWSAALLLLESAPKVVGPAADLMCSLNVRVCPEWPLALQLLGRAAPSSELSRTAALQRCLWEGAVEVLQGAKDAHLRLSSSLLGASLAKASDAPLVAWKGALAAALRLLVAERKRQDGTGPSQPPLRPGRIGRSSATV
ncbi:unnamed protein product [Effrenium voratum]|nr:unnamed protein product [Effrenium voratum]